MIPELPYGWTFTHLIAIGWLHGDDQQGFQVHLLNTDYQVVVSATGDTVESTFAEAIARTYDDRWHQPIFTMDSVRAPDEPKLDLIALLHKHREPLKRRI